MEVNKKKKKLDIDVYIGIFLALFAGFFLYESFKLHEIAAQFPKIILTILILLSIVLIIIGLRKTANPEADKSDIQLNLEIIQAPMVVFVIIAIYIFLINIIGFYLSTIIFVPALMIYYGVKNIRLLLITNIALNLFIYGLFTQLLKVMLP